MQDDIQTEQPFDDQPSTNKAYWIQGLEDAVWKNLDHYPTSEEALAQLSDFVSSNKYSELRLVSATFSPYTETVDYKLLAKITGGNVLRPDNNETITPIIMPKPTPKMAQTIAPTAGDPYAPYAFEDTSTLDIDTPDIDKPDEIPVHLDGHLGRPLLLSGDAEEVQKSNGSRILFLLLIVLFGVLGGLYIYNPDGITNLVNQAYEIINDDPDVSTNSEDVPVISSPPVAELEELVPSPNDGDSNMADNTTSTTDEQVVGDTQIPEAGAGANMRISNEGSEADEGLLQDLRRALGKDKN